MILMNKFLKGNNIFIINKEWENLKIGDDIYYTLFSTNTIFT